MGTTSVPSSTLCLISGVAKWGYLFFGQKETGAERVAMVTPLRVSFYFFCDAHLWSQVQTLTRPTLKVFKVPMT